ncbi:IS4 family transposase [Porphyromonas macacae]|uniref:Transposase n=1 Tax=Porphyromonas macacae TaxID=28115 RepID=A0A379DI09_9PORP|nr:IS4 family transposase [Porphyromonas macacae]SUB77986.1 Transposase [Porphyromonas macacae]SUB78200.1 Transposase [Porphyromonas macacae]SUB78312.1 Transposase [Porphyromonas macacae]
MSKSKHFFGQPIYSQLLHLLDKSQVLQHSRTHTGERYIKRFDAWTHLVVMLYAVIRRFDSLREITASLQAEGHKLKHLGIDFPAARSTLSDANKRRPQAIFAAIYHDLYARYAQELSSDSRTHSAPQWMKRLQIIDSTTITLFSNLIFKGVGRHPKNGKKKGGIKVHTVIHANECVPSDVRFTSAATHDSFMLSPAHLPSGSVIALDRAYVDYEKFEQMTGQGIVYVTKMKKRLNYELLTDTMLQTPEGAMELRLQEVVFIKKRSAEESIRHRARIITYVDVAKRKLVSLLSNDLESDPRELIEIYRKRWLIELLFKQIKQNFPLKYFYGESANAIQIQIWVTLIANLLLMVMQRRLKRSWSFSGLATMVRIVLMYYMDFYSLFNHPEQDWIAQFAQEEAPPEPNLFDWGAY